MMIHILLLILKIIGIILLSILGLIILLILLICLTPLKYEIYGQVNNSKESLAGKIKFGYFFNILNGQFVYKDGRPRYYVAVFKKKLICSRKPKEESTKEESTKEYEEPVKESTSKVAREQTKEAHKEPDFEMKNPFEGEITEKDFKYVEKSASSNESSKENKSKKKDSKKKDSDKPKEPKKSRFKSAKEKIKNMYSTICDKIRVLKEKKKIIDTFFNDKIHKKAILKVFKEIKVLLRKLKPYNLKCKAHYGFENPELTGKSLAVISMVLPFIGGELDIQPDFNNELVYRGNISFNGKIKLSYFVTLCIKLAVRKSVWTTFFDAKHIIDDIK